MDASYWHDRWATQRIGWHQSAPNKFLVQYFSVLKLAANSHVFVPLCGKTQDIGWLLEQGHCVSGAELDESAVVELFQQLSIEPSITPIGDIIRYVGEGLTVYVGDIFNLSAETLGPVDACFDRAAIVALPPPMRILYAKHLSQITNKAIQLLITFTYDQSLMEGPPHSVPADEVQQHYSSEYEIELIIDSPVKEGLRGLDDVREQAWKLSPK